MLRGDKVVGSPFYKETKGIDDLLFRTCEYLLFEIEDEGESLKRFYHPMSSPFGKDENYIDILVKVYQRDLKYPKGGKFTQILGNTLLKIH